MLSTKHKIDISEWRKSRFVALGFNPATAEQLATQLNPTTGKLVDLHDTKKLLDAGCPHNTAFMILL